MAQNLLIRVMKLGEADFDSAMERYVFIELCHRATYDGTLRLSQIDIAAVTLCSLRTVTHAFESLQAKGLLERLSHGRYQITLPDDDE